MPKAFDKLVKKIKKKGSAKNPFAVARSVLGSNEDIKNHVKPKGK
jgi:hypothetical protein